ncbi:MAG: hypothetical protein ABEN55_23105, partial [Bradymonadaceae bacterium]
EVYLEVVPGGEFPWREYYLALGAVASALVFVGWANVGPFGAVPDIAFAAVLAGLAWWGVRTAHHSELRKTPLADLADRDTWRTQLTTVGLTYPHFAVGAVLLAVCPTRWGPETYALAAGFGAAYLAAAVHAHLGLMARAGLLEPAPVEITDLARSE